MEKEPRGPIGYIILGISIGAVGILVLSLAGARVTGFNFGPLQLELPTGAMLDQRTPTQPHTQAGTVTATAATAPPATIGGGARTQVTQVAESAIGVQETDQAPASSPDRNSCLATEHTFLGDGWVSQPVFRPTAAGASHIFSHCPPMTTIQYDSIAVDDEVQKVELVCHSSTTDITSLFEPFSVEGELLLHWRSSRITLESGCRIDFTIRDRAGVQVGLQIKKSQP